MMWISGPFTLSISEYSSQTIIFYHTLLSADPTLLDTICPTLQSLQSLCTSLSLYIFPSLSLSHIYIISLSCWTPSVPLSEPSLYCTSLSLSLSLSIDMSMTITNPHNLWSHLGHSVLKIVRLIHKQIMDSHQGRNLSDPSSGPSQTELLQVLRACVGLLYVCAQTKPILFLNSVMNVFESPQSRSTSRGMCSCTIYDNLILYIIILVYV